MTFLQMFQLNGYTILMLIILFVIISVRLCVQTYGKQLLLLTILFTIAALINEPIAWALDGSPSTFGYVFEYISNMLELLFGPIIIALMLQYVSYRTVQNRKSIIKLFLTFPPIIFTVIMLIINLFVPIYFSVDHITHDYSTESLIWIQYVLIAICYLYMVGYVYTKRQKLDKYKIAIFYVFFLLPIIGMFIQLMDSKLFVSWTSIALSILVVYVFLESTDGEKDYLTKLFNRQSYETCITQKMEQSIPFAILFIDLDRFKAINDLHGHVMGDYVLVEFSNLLQSVFHNEFCARLGGDEFMVISTKTKSLDESIEQLRQLISNHPHNLISSLQFSYGIQSYEVAVTIDELYNLVDQKMYDYKRQNKTLNRRQTD